MSDVQQRKRPFSIQNKKKERIIIIIIAVQGVGLSVTKKIYKNE